MPNHCIYIDVTDPSVQEFLNQHENEALHNKKELDLETFYSVVGSEGAAYGLDMIKVMKSCQIIRREKKLSDSEYETDTDVAEREKEAEKREEAERDGSRNHLPNNGSSSSSIGSVVDCTKEVKLGTTSEVDTLSTLSSNMRSKPRRKKKPPLSEIEILRLKADERAYQRSIQGVLPGKRNNTVSKEIRAISESLNMASHFIFAFIGAFLFGYFSCQLFLIEDVAMQCICGGIASFITLLLETILFFVRDQKEQCKQKRMEREARTGVYTNVEIVKKQKPSELEKVEKPSFQGGDTKAGDAKMEEVGDAKAEDVATHGIGNPEGAKSDQESMSKTSSDIETTATATTDMPTDTDNDNLRQRNGMELRQRTS